MRKRKYAHGVANYYRPDTLTEHIDEFWTKKMKQKLDNVDNVDNLDNSDNLINVDSNLGNLDHLNLDHLHDFFKSGHSQELDVGEEPTASVHNLVGTARLCSTDLPLDLHDVSFLVLSFLSDILG